MLGINKAALTEAQEKGIVASCVTGRLHRDINGNTYFSYCLEVKIKGSKFPVTLAVKSRAYGYGDEYRRHAEKVLKYYGLGDDVDFYNNTVGPKRDMFTIYNGLEEVDF